MRLLLWCLAPFTLAGIAYVAAQSLAAHDWLTAGPLLVLLAVGIALIVPGDEAHPHPNRRVSPSDPAQRAWATTDFHQGSRAWPITRPV